MSHLPFFKEFRTAHTEDISFDRIIGVVFKKRQGDR